MAASYFGNNTAGTSAATQQPRRPVRSVTLATMSPASIITADPVKLACPRKITPSSTPNHCKRDEPQIIKNNQKIKVF